MGLDMYLEVRRSTYLPKGKRTIDLDNLKENFDNYFDDEFGCSNSVEIVEQVGYWRKANAIHHWFVDNVQEGVDECQTSYVSIKDLDKLLGLCNGVLDRIEGCKFVLSEESKKYCTKFKDSFVFHKKNIKDIFTNGGLWNYEIAVPKEAIEFINENLPPHKGFFFGTTEINGNYFYDIIKTVLIIKRLKKMMNNWKKDKVYADITYHASW